MFKNSFGKSKLGKIISKYLNFFDKLTKTPVFTYISDLSKYRPVYAPKDFLEVLLTLSGYIPYTRE